MPRYPNKRRCQTPNIIHDPGNFEQRLTAFHILEKELKKKADPQNNHPDIGDPPP